ncbi:NfeD family protein [Caldicoprobacter faecalis]|uniref:NfeD-like C-terminal, partner-binding n=1 Tax=Caldicoprobacter faecalis TaxID=937334 RepID=A0A1I5WS21_9FIRM|nr:NfeD family protein [Caldicoprobacter faecalis]SFQ22539.1 NfeD-like C-terminal, partner-binding [Caldicoprobacter faecalis]
MALIEVFEYLEWLMALLFILGAVLVAIEFMVPGFGIAGTLGIISLLLGIVVASRVVSPPVLVGIIAAVLLVIVSLLVWAYRSATKGGKISRTLLLHSRLDKEQGYTSVQPEESLVGMEGVALSMLRPSGTAQIGDRRVDVVTEGEFIPKGTRVRVIKVEGFRVVVARADDK